MTVKLMSLSKNTDNSWKKGMWNTYNRWPDMKVIPGAGTKNYFLFGKNYFCLATTQFPLLTQDRLARGRAKKVVSSVPQQAIFLADELFSAPGSKASEAGCLQ